MRILISVVALTVVSAVPLTARAQARTMPDSAQLAAMQKSISQMNSPAEFVLRHRTDLALTAAQISNLELLAVAHRDSVVVRLAKYMEQMQAQAKSPALISAASWTGDVDVPALRAAVYESSGMQVDIMLDLVRDRRAAAALLTPSQVASLEQLAVNDLVNAVKKP